MKPIVMTKEAEAELLNVFAAKFQKELDSFKFNMNESKFSMTMDLSQQAKEKITILYTQQAYLRMMSLVNYYDTEVGWYGLVEKKADRLYRVYDVKVCKQIVDGAKVDTKDEDTLEFFDSLTDEEAEHMHFQAHSHVKMSTGASGIDLQNQADVIRNMGKTGFYIFQIWNKYGDINTYFYNLDENMFYDKKDVVLEIEDGNGVMSDFLSDTEALVVEKKAVLYNQYGGYYPASYSKFDDFYPKKNGKRKKKEESVYLNEYWDGNDYSEGGNW